MGAEIDTCVKVFGVFVQDEKLVKTTTVFLTVASERCSTLLCSACIYKHTLTMTSTTTKPTRSILNPLRTTFTPPSYCSLLLFATTELSGNGYVNVSNVAHRGVTCANKRETEVGNIVSDNTTCWPPIEEIVEGVGFFGLGFYSPGLLCPSGYSTACSAALLSNSAVSTITSGQSFAFQFPLIPGETAVGCCPRYVFPLQSPNIYGNAAETN